MLFVFLIAILIIMTVLMNIIILFLRFRVLTVHGSADEIVPAEDAKEFAKLIANHKLCIIEGANHNYTKHQSELASIVLDFLKRGCPPSSNCMITLRSRLWNACNEYTASGKKGKWYIRSKNHMQLGKYFWSPNSCEIFPYKSFRGKHSEIFLPNQHPACVGII